MQHLEELLSAGYEVTFASPAKDMYEVTLIMPGDSAVIGTAETPDEALWEVSPFHAPDAPYPGSASAVLEDTAASLATSASKLHLTTAAISALWDEAQSRAVSALEKRVDALETGPIDGDRVRLRPDCECGHSCVGHTEESPDVDGLSGRRMCGREDCMCLAYRPDMSLMPGA